MTWRREDATRNALMGMAAVIGIAIIAAPFMPSLRRYLRMKRM